MPGSGTRPVTSTVIAGLVPQVTCGAILLGLDHDVAVEGRWVVGLQRLPVGDGCFERRALRRERAIPPGDVLDRGVVGGDQARPGPGLDRHVADRQAALHRERLDRRPVVFDDGARRPAGADLADDREDDVLRLQARGELAADLDPERDRPSALPQGLGGQDVLDLAWSRSRRLGHPKAPWVLVWLSPQTIVVPGKVSPSSGPITWTIPCRPPWTSNSVRPNSRQLFRSVSTCRRDIGSLMSSWNSVGTLWSTVATVKSGRRTFRPASRSPSNAWGLVTS